MIKLKYKFKIKYYKKLINKIVLSDFFILP